MISRRDFLKTAAAGVALGGSRRLFAAVEAGAVRGTVLGGAAPLADVLVSDGCRVARTDAAGAYRLPIGPDSGRFVFVTTPRDYWIDKFFVPIQAAVQTGRADFALRSMDQPERFDLVFITDMHLENRQWGVPKVQASLREINDLKPTPSLLWAQGDICLQGSAGSDYLECLALCKMPVRNGPGNHEMLLEHENPRDEFERLFGPTYYSFDWGPVHCIVLDGNKPIPGEQGWKAVHGAIEGSELAWLQADLAAQPEGKPIIVGVHIPIVTTYPERRRESPKDAPYWEMANDEVLTDLLARHHVRLVLQGHMHENERTTVKGVEYVESISLSGSWYQSGAAVERGVDGTPRGYRIVSVDGTRITHHYRSSCESHVDRQAEFVGLGSAIPAQPKAELVLNCYDAPNGSAARARIDQGPWQPMPAFAAMNESIGLAMPHHFRLVADLTALSPGPHAIEARIEWPDGTVVDEKATFQVEGEPFFLTRGIVLVVGDLSTLDWPARAKRAGLTTIATHIFPHEVAAFLKTDRGQQFLAECRTLGIQVEHELHAMSDLLPRSLFDKDPAMFPMNDKGDRVRDFNLCVHSESALSTVCENAVKYAGLLRPTTGRYFYWIDDGRPMCRCPKCRELSDSDQALVLENRVLEALRGVDSRATLAHLAYARTLQPPTQVKPSPGVFLEFAPIARRYDKPFADREARPGGGPSHGEMLDLLDANLAVFGREGAQALEYWLDLSRFSGWRRENVRLLPWNGDVYRADLRAYAQRGVRHVTSFGAWLDGDYVKRFGDPPVNAYAAGMLRWNMVQGRAVERGRE